MPNTAYRTFKEDIDRAQALIDHAQTMPFTTPADKLLQKDVLRSGWMFAVGAMDAYFCDAYADVVSSTFIALSNPHPSTVALPPFMSEIMVPAATLLRTYSTRGNWRWRMAGRQMMMTENALQLDQIAAWFNPFLSDGNKLFNEVIEAWVELSTATARVFGRDPTVISSLTGAARNAALKNARKAFRRRYREIIQRRHDCIHTCDRPVSLPQAISSAGTVRNVIRDISFLVHNTDIHLNTEIRNFLIGCGFSAGHAAAVGY